MWVGGGHCFYLQSGSSLSFENSSWFLKLWDVFGKTEFEAFAVDVNPNPSNFAPHPHPNIALLFMTLIVKA